MDKKIGCIIQARLTSTRFPKKILMNLFGKSVIEHVIDSCYDSKLIDKIVIAAPHSLGVCLNEELFIGSEENVLDRYYQCASKYGFDIIVRVTSDCPLVSSYEIDRVISRILEGDTDYVTNIGASGRFGLPDGFDVEAFTYRSLKESWERGIPDEHVTSWIKSNVIYNPILLEAPKLSLDTPEDFERIKQYVRWQANTNHRWYRILCSELPNSYSFKS